MVKKENLYGKGKAIISAGITMGVKTEEKPLKEDISNIVNQDPRIIRLNELKSVKMSAISSKKRPDAKEAKKFANRILESWADYDELRNILLDIKGEDFENEDIWKIMNSRIGEIESNIKFVKKVNDMAVRKEKAVKTGKPVPTDVQKEKTSKEKLEDQKNKVSKEVAPNKPKEELPIIKEVKTSRKVGDVNVKHPTWIWTEYKPGRFDWRTNPADKKQGQRTDIKETKTPSVPKAKKEKTVKTKPSKGFTVAEFLSVPRKTKELSKAQQLAQKFILKGYSIVKIDETFFFRNEEGKQESCSMEVINALFHKYGYETLPTDLIK